MKLPGLSVATLDFPTQSIKVAIAAPSSSAAIFEGSEFRRPKTISFTESLEKSKVLTFRSNHTGQDLQGAVNFEPVITTLAGLVKDLMQKKIELIPNHVNFYPPPSHSMHLELQLLGINC